MNTPPSPLSSTTLLREAETRMAQALSNFFQRSRIDIRERVLRAMAEQITPDLLASGQTCLDWVDAYPHRLSAALGNQFSQQLDHPDAFAQQGREAPLRLELVDDAVLARQLAIDKSAAQLTEALRPEMIVLFSRLQTLRQEARDDDDHLAIYAPLGVLRALSRALDELGLDPRHGTLLLQCASAPLLETLKHTYAALNQYLYENGVQERPRTPGRAVSPSRQTASDPGQEILALIQGAASHSAAPLPRPSGAPGGGHPPVYGGFTGPPPRFFDSLNAWQSRVSQEPSREISADVLRRLQHHARETDAGTLDLAVLDAVAGLFEFILDDPDVSPGYKSEIVQLQIPTLRVALTAPDFFSDDHHPARLLIDLLGRFSRHFPERSPSHADALAQVAIACERVLSQPAQQTEAFAEAHTALAEWLDRENARIEAELASEVSNLEQIERQELGTLLALENLRDLTARYPVPESVLRRLETAWVPYMMSLYVAEAGEGPQWRKACMTMLNLFVSLQPPENEQAREACLRSIPEVNAELRRGLLAEGAAPEQLRDFFSAITATQECWVRPQLGHPQAAISTFVPQRVSPEEIEQLAQRLADAPMQDPVLQQTQQLLEGDWVDFDPPFEGLATARVAWVGVHGYLLFCDSAGERHFSLDCRRLAEAMRAGHAHIPEQSLTRKAMLRLKTQLLTGPH